MNSLLLRWKIFQICREIKRHIQAYGVHCWVWWFGAYDIDPKHLVFVAAAQSDAERDRLRSDIALNASLRDLLRVFSWPEAARPHVQFDIESEETVTSDTKGNWWYHYK